MAILEIGLIILAIRSYQSAKRELRESENEVERKRDELQSVVVEQSEKFNKKIHDTNFEVDFQKMNTQFFALTTAMKNSYNYLKNIEKQEKLLRIHKDNLKVEMDRLYPSKIDSDHSKIREYKEARDKIIETLKEHEQNIKDSVAFLAKCKQEKEKIAEYIRDNCGRGGQSWYQKNFTD